jgi:hypothetical protein
LINCIGSAFPIQPSRSDPIVPTPGYSAVLNSGCKALPDTEACLQYVDKLQIDKTERSATIIDSTMIWENTKQTFYYYWDNDNLLLHMSAVKNEKKLKIEAKNDLKTLVRINMQNAGNEEG